MTRRKVHILEGSDSSGGRIYACGRTSPRYGDTSSVGRAHLEKHGDAVTCQACIRKYAMTFALIERKRLDPTAPDAIAMPKRST